MSKPGEDHEAGEQLVPNFGLPAALLTLYVALVLVTALTYMAESLP
jgi:hypothetical protein